jgi:hypothetical protein
MDKVILRQNDGYTNPSNPLWGRFRTYLIDIDNKSHRRWLNRQYKLGDVMVSHQVINAEVPEEITHIPTNITLESEGL